MAGSKLATNGWQELKNWRASGKSSLYSVGGGFDGKTGRFTAPKTGVYYCSTQVRLDGINGYFRLGLALDGNHEDTNNGEQREGVMGTVLWSFDTTNNV